MRPPVERVLDLRYVAEYVGTKTQPVAPTHLSMLFLVRLLAFPMCEGSRAMSHPSDIL